MTRVAVCIEVGREDRSGVRSCGGGSARTDADMTSPPYARFWFYVPALASGAATACFTIATALSA